ncbi:MAG: general secretion pathway protein GspL [Deltaproteobacteria bacterium]|nr:general secretion pathway protein GspL [Deltaproteobacteria bacterium]
MARWLGIDLSATTVRVALVSSSYRKLGIEALREESVADHPSVVAAIRAATVGLRPDACAAGLEGRKTFTRKLDLPRAALKDLDNVLAFEVEATLPFELDDAVMDHRRLKTDVGLDTLPIFAGVATASDVRARIDVIKEGAGIDPSRIALGPLPLLNLGQVAKELLLDKPLAVVDLAEDGCDVLIASGGEPRFIRSLSRGTRGLPDDTPKLARELKQTLAAWRASGGEPIDRVLVTGPGAAIPGLEPFLHVELGVGLGALPKLGLEVSTELSPLVTRFARAVALALSLSRRPVDLNLRRGALEAQQSYQFLREKAPLLSGLGAGLLVSLGFAVFAEQRALDRERATLEDQLAAVTQAYFETATRDPKEAADMLDAAISGKSDDPRPGFDGFDVLVALSERIPPELTHDIVDFDFKKNQLTLKGLVNTIDDANTVEKRVAEHPCAKDVNLSHTTKLKEKNKQKYTLELKIDCGKGKPDKKAPAPKPSASGEAP